MSVLPPGNTPLIVFRTGAAGYVEAIAVAIYTVALVVYYVGPFLYTDASAYNALFNIFYIWACFKPILPVLSAIYTVLQIYTLVPIIIYMVLAGIMAIGSLGLFITLVADLTRCNTANHPDLACNDPLYCCAFWNQTTACAGLGPCNGTITTVQVPSDLRVAENHTWLTWFTLALFGFEILLAVLTYLVYQRRFIKFRQAEVLIQEAVVEKYGPGSVPELPIGVQLPTVGTRIHHYRNQHQLPYWQASAHATFDWLDDWIDYARYHLEHQITQSVGISLLQHEYDDLMAANAIKKKDNIINTPATTTTTTTTAMMASPVFSSSAQDAMRATHAIRPSSDWMLKRRGVVRGNQ